MKFDKRNFSPKASLRQFVALATKWHRWTCAPKRTGRGYPMPYAFPTARVFAASNNFGPSRQRRAWCAIRTATGFPGDGGEPSEMVRRLGLESFVARIWLEGQTNGDPIWRGHIRHIQGKQETYFQGLAEMKEFLERVSGVAGPSLTAQAQEGTSKSPSASVASLKRKD